MHPVCSFWMTSRPFHRHRAAPPHLFPSLSCVLVLYLQIFHPVPFFPRLWLLSHPLSSSLLVSLHVFKPDFPCPPLPRAGLQSHIAGVCRLLSLSAGAHSQVDAHPGPQGESVAASKDAQKTAEFFKVPPIGTPWGTRRVFRCSIALASSHLLTEIHWYDPLPYSSAALFLILLSPCSCRNALWAALSSSTSPNSKSVTSAILQLFELEAMQCRKQSLRCFT